MEKNTIAKIKIMDMWKEKKSYYAIKEAIQELRDRKEVTLSAYVKLNKINENYRMFS